MATLEHVEKLRERANVTYEEAKQALDACGDDLLDAMIYLENHGKVVAPFGGGSYTSCTKEEHKKDKRIPPVDEGQPSGETFSQVLGRFFRFCGRIIDKGNRNMFDVWRYGKITFSLPVTVLVLLLIIAFPIVMPLVIVGLFFGFRYRFSGRDLENNVINKAMDSAASAAETFKDEMRQRRDEEETNGQNHN